MNTNQTIAIESLNYYEYILPDRKLVNNEKLILIKMLRSEGINVVVLPDDGKPFQYVFNKGLKDILVDPIMGFYLNMGVSIVAGTISGVLSNFITKLIERKKDTPTVNIQNLIIQGVNQSEYYKDNLVANEKAEKITDETKNKKILFRECFNQTSPYPDKPMPLFLNHQPEIVGWCKAEFNNDGINVTDGIITHGSVKWGIENGTYRGLSVGGVAESSICSICSNEYVNCNHITGEQYNGIRCTIRIVKSIPIEISIVNESINPECLINIH